MSRPVSHHEPQPAAAGASAADAVRAIADRKILCAGDVMLDVSVGLRNGRLSPEAPVLVFAEDDQRMHAGGAANVALGVLALGADVALAGVVGDDEDGRILVDMLGEAGVDPLVDTLDPSIGPTTRKTRFVADGQQILRVDRERIVAAHAQKCRRLAAHVADEATRIDAVLVSDYGKGFVTAEVIGLCRDLATAQRAPLLVDPKGRDWARYGVVDLIKPNAAELADFTGFACDGDAQIETALRAALEACPAAAILVTRGAEGASYLRRGAPRAVHYPARRVEVADVCGAGDTSLAVLGCLLAARAPIETAIEVSQVASALAIQRHGNASIGAGELMAELGHGDAPPSRLGVVDRDGLRRIVEAWRAQGLAIGFTNGCFDLLHRGHIAALEVARSHCDRLIVGLNSDASVRRLKGASRPVQPEADRARILAALAAVDAVAVFDEDRPDALIALVEPDVLVKGGDYDPQTIAGGDLVRARGGRVLAAPFVEARSTSRIIDSIQALPVGSQCPADERKRA